MGTGRRQVMPPGFPFSQPPEELLIGFDPQWRFSISVWSVLRRLGRYATAFLCRIERAACFSYAACDDVLLGATEE